MTEYQYNLAIRFYEVAGIHARRVALQYPDGRSFSYAELNRMSNQAGRYLRNGGVRKGDVVAIFNEKSPLAYSLMLGCIKIGAIYTNLDNTSPWARLHKILGTCTPKVIFIDKWGSIPADECKTSFPTIPIINLQEGSFNAELSALDETDIIETSLEIHGADPVYIMFTSGSTGFPKGAVMSHSNVLNFIQWGKQTFSVTEQDIFTNANPIYFDNSVFDFYTSIYNGAALVPLNHDLVKNARQLVQAINDSKCTIWFSVPSLLVYLLTTRSLSKDDFQTIKRIAFGGEGFPKNKLKQLFDMFSNRVILYNVYGPTECTCICSSHKINDKDFENMNELTTLGYIAPNFGYEILVMDPNDRDLGELALTGPCVGLGYYNDMERTGKSFVQNPFKSYYQRMYKTGDLVERADNGYLYFRGRVDNQIKHMGYRIELEEIEAAFSTLAYINEVGVIYEKLNAELGQIKAYVSVSERAIDGRRILDDIKQLLPPYMLPKIISLMDTLPKNANGKIDRKQLTLLRS